MPLYEVLLRQDDDEETRLTDQEPRIGETISIGEERWIVQGRETPKRADAAARYICVRAHATK